jgi:adenylate cyclase class IV
MALTNIEKRNLATEVKHLKEMGYSKTEAVKKLHWAYGYKKRTIETYWKVFNDGSS